MLLQGQRRKIMDTAWIQVFVLSLSECAAPAGKTVCQEQEISYQFFDKAECEAVLEQLIAYKDGADNVIVHQDQSRCLPTVRQATTYASVREANEHLSGLEDWGTLPVEQEGPKVTSQAHNARLDQLPACDDRYSVTPCKIGQIIVESDGSEPVPVWRRDGDN
jgi:hypothetical protein